TVSINPSTGTLTATAFSGNLTGFATTGQNGLNQAEVFIQSIGVTGFIVTKLDGSAKGGISIAIEKSSGLPIKFIGSGERLEDFGPFDQTSFIAGLFD
ncbi:MAG: hypothetical protein EBW24_01455, partial [Actinobacteria bacterium]|nr:hypothetical protein [Actinomycetota bacterium]